eukprot:1337211-Pleurochrysis_carterae.AAC.2
MSRQQPSHSHDCIRRSEQVRSPSRLRHTVRPHGRKQLAGGGCVGGGESGVGNDGGGGVRGGVDGGGLAGN